MYNMYYLPKFSDCKASLTQMQKVSFLNSLRFCRQYNNIQLQSRMNWLLNKSLASRAESSTDHTQGCIWVLDYKYNQPNRNFYDKWVFFKALIIKCCWSKTFFEEFLQFHLMSWKWKWWFTKSVSLIWIISSQIWFYRPNKTTLDFFSILFTPGINIYLL